MLMMQSLCRFVIVTTVPSGGGLVIGEAVHMSGQGMYGSSLCIPHNFVVNLKLLLTTKFVY